MAEEVGRRLLTVGSRREDGKLVVDGSEMTVRGREREERDVIDR